MILILNIEYSSVLVRRSRCRLLSIFRQGLRSLLYYIRRHKPPSDGILLSSRLFKHSVRSILVVPSNIRLANWRLLRDDFGVFTASLFSIESLDASSSPPECVNRSESSSEIAEEDVSSSSIMLVDKGGTALIKGRVH